MEFTGERFVPGKAYGEIEVEHLQRYSSIRDLVKNKVVLDAACGEGYGSSILANYASKVTGIDISPEAVKWAQEKYGNDKLDFITNSIEKLPFPDNSFDAVVSFETIEHVDEEIQNRFLKEIKRVLKKDGILVISTPDKRNYSDIPNYNNLYHVKEFYYDEFHSFLNGVFKEVYLFDQGYEQFSILKSSNFRSSTGSTRVLNDIGNDYRLYIIAVCSDIKIENIESVNSCMIFKKNLSKLYMDFGDGYSEENALRSEYRLDGKAFFVEFQNLDELSNIKGLKVIPVLEKTCKFKINEVTSNVGNLLTCSSMKDFDELLSVNPVYELTGDFTGLANIRIEGELIVVGANEVYFKMNELLNQKEQQLVQTEHQLVQTEHQLVQTEHQLRDMIDSLSWKLTAPLRRAKRFLVRG